MTFSNAMQRSQDLLQQIASHQLVTENGELNALVIALSQELENIKTLSNETEQTPHDSQEQGTSPQVDKQSGCYKFENEQGYFCPNCYDQTGSRIPTKRLNRLLRVCPSCRSSIKPSK